MNSPEIRATIILQTVRFGEVSKLKKFATTNHVPVKVVEEGYQVETKLYEALLLVRAQCSEDLRCIVHMIRVHNSIVDESLKERIR